ncbi:hydroxysteroid 11-beta-dehydrogenase 1-like protein isoform X1 [Excalfactoria chinensis]|uniref:hydroxysteroid 11-beta-dehydrogenase 1-like protein isoform X1 n=1 Tax=Excalfactoria chinensis TaxID=46218 RepID=UPI003B3A3C8E
MRPVGKLLCAAGSLAVLLSFCCRDTFQPELLSGARVLLTGASAGIGEQMAYHYAAFGAEMVLTARRETALREVMEKCLSLGAKKVFYLPADMASPSEPDRVVQFAVQKLGGLDYLVLNHIGTSPFQMWGGDVEHSRWLMQVNFFSYVALASAALPTLEENHGSLLVVSSLSVRSGRILRLVAPRADDAGKERVGDAVCAGPHRHRHGAGEDPWQGVPLRLSRLGSCSQHYPCRCFPPPGAVLPVVAAARARSVGAAAQPARAAKLLQLQQRLTDTRTDGQRQTDGQTDGLTASPSGWLRDGPSGARGICKCCGAARFPIGP